MVALRRTKSARSLSEWSVNWCSTPVRPPPQGRPEDVALSTVCGQQARARGSWAMKWFDSGSIVKPARLSKDWARAALETPFSRPPIAARSPIYRPRFARPAIDREGRRGLLLHRLSVMRGKDGRDTSNVRPEATRREPVRNAAAAARAHRSALGSVGVTTTDEEDVPSSVELRWRSGEHQAALTSSLCTSGPTGSAISRSSAARSDGRCR